MRRRHPILFALLLVFAAVPASAQQKAAAKLGIDPRVTVGTLPNGLRYYIRTNPKPEKRAELRLVVNAGSVLENADQRGLAHMLEHMAFNGTRHFEKQHLVSYLESIGMRFGADLNAYTSFDETVYMLTVPTDTGTALDKGFQILQDWSRGLTLDTMEINKERGVVIEEWRLGRGAEQRLQDKVFPVLFNNSRYADRLPIGDKQTLESFRPGTLRAFYNQWYRPDLMAVVAVGDFDKNKVEKLIRENFGQIPRAARPTARTVFPVPAHDKTVVAIATDKEASFSQVEVYYLRPVRLVTTVAAHRQSLIEDLYDEMLNGRLRELTQQSDPPFIGASSGIGRLVRSSGVYVLSAAVKENGVERGLETLFTEAERVSRHGFTATELDRAKRNMLRSLETSYNEREKTNSEAYASEYVRNFLQKDPIPGIAREYELAKQLLPGIKLSEVNALPAALMGKGNSVIVLEQPEKAGVHVPTKDALLAIAASAKKKDIAPYDDKVTNAALLPKVPLAGRIVEEKKTAAINLTEWRLSNGARVLLRPTDFKQDEVLFRAYGPGGTSIAPDKDFQSAQFSDLLVSVGGVGQFNAIELQKALAGKNAQVSPFVADLDQGLSGGGSPRDLDTMLQLAHLYFTSPRQDTTSFQSVMTRYRQALANRSVDPNAAFQDTVQVTLGQHNVRTRPISAVLLDEVDLGKAVGFYRERFADASGYTFVFVGSFSPDSLRPLVEKYLASLPSSNSKQTWRDTGIRPPTGIVEKAVRKGVEPKSETLMLFNGDFNYVPEERRALNAVSDVLEIMLRDKLREELGGTYGVNVSATFSKLPYPHYSFAIDFGSAPTRVDELTKATFTLIDSLKANGPTADVLQKVKETQRRQYETSLKQNGFWISSIVVRDQSGEDQTNILNNVSNVDKITADIVRDAARKYLRTDNYVKISLFPEKG